MTRMVARVLMWLALVAVTVAAGVHTIHYLFQWQWERAQIAGIGFLASMILGATFAIMGRLRRIEERLETLSRTQPAASPTPPANGEPRPDFRWLTPTHSFPALLGLVALAVPLGAPDQGVFIPVFLAAGLVVSVAASGVERLASWRHDGHQGGHQRGHGHARASGGVALHPQPTWALLAVPAVAMVLIATLIGGLYWGSHYWSEPVGPGITTMTVEVERNGPVTSDLETVEAVARYCVLNVNAGAPLHFEGVAPGPGSTTRLQVSPLLDWDAQNRFVGCLEDAVLDQHQLRVSQTALDPR